MSATDKTDDLLSIISKLIDKGDIDGAKALITKSFADTELGGEVLALLLSSNSKKVKSKKDRIQLIFKLITLGRKYG
jgi:hypothetical protein